VTLVTLWIFAVGRLAKTRDSVPGLGLDSS
jgi:hypothetical protein